MQNSTSLPPTLRFGVFELDPRVGELKKKGMKIRLQEQPVEILAMLLERPGETITREELQKKLWPADTFVDFEQGLNNAMKRLRAALDDNAESPHFIETVPRHGYRFIGSVSGPEQTPATEAKTARSAGRPSSGAIILNEARRHKGTVALMFFGLLLLIIALGIYFSRLSERRSEWNLQAMKISRVTQSGNATNVAISPDGRYVVYALREGEKQSLNVRQVATGSDVQILPPDEVWIWGLTFSPDANYIDFVRSEKPNFTDTHLYRMPVLGGTPHLAMQGGIDFGSSYSPDGTEFAFLRVNSSDGKVDVLIAKADGSDQRVLASRPYRDEFIGVAWSPDGKTIAFTTSEATKRLRSVLWAISVADGSVREIYSTRTPSVVRAGCPTEVVSWRP